MRRALLASLALALVGCDSGSSAGSTDAGSTDASSIDGGATTDCLAGLLGTTEDPVSILRFTGQDGLEVRLARVYVDHAAGDTAVYAIRGFAVTDAPGGDELCTTDAASLAYENTHHNWYDEATATSGGHTYLLTMHIDLSIGNAFTNRLVIDEGEPLALTLDGCTNQPASTGGTGCTHLPTPSTP